MFLKSGLITPQKVILIGLLLFLVSCENPFATREAEPPITNQSSWIQPTSATIVMANLKNAISEKNISNYMRCLADTANSPKSFVYFAEPSVALKNPGVFARWHKQEELNFMNQLMLYLPRDSASVLSFKTLRETPTADSLVFLNEYTLRLGLKCEGDCPRLLTGQAEFRLVKTDEDLWYIHRWSDFSTGSGTTWSELRAYFGK